MNMHFIVTSHLLVLQFEDRFGQHIVAMQTSEHLLIT
jgi:hypothetical protein